MKIVRSAGIAAVLLLGLTAPASPQHGRQDDRRGKPEHGDKRQGSDGPRERPNRKEQFQQPRMSGGRDYREQARRQPQPNRTREHAVAWQKQRGWVKPGAWQGYGSWEKNRAKHWKMEHRTWAQRGGYGGYYISPAIFSVHFGRNHWFRIRHRPTIYMGFPRFAYGGFSFLLVDPWPEHWVDNWYETDDVFVDYDDGYYLCNRREPGLRIAITVAL